MMMTATWAAAGEQPRRAQKPAGEPSVYKKVGDRELTLYVLKPTDWRAGDSRPAIVLFHGGGWRGGSPSLLNPQAKYFAGRGMVTVLVEYRLTKRGGTQPPIECCQDAKSAMRWVRSRAKDLGVDPSRIAAGGGSAGGHLAAFASMVEGLDDPQDDKAVSSKANALVLFNPVFNNGPDNYGYNRVGSRYKEFSPAHNIRPDAPPTIVMFGTKDRFVPVSTAEAFRDEMKRQGVRCDLIFYDGQLHGFFNDRPWREKTLQDADRFLVSLKWLSGQTTSGEQP